MEPRSSLVSRRDVLAAGVALAAQPAVAAVSPVVAQDAALRTRPIPSSGEPLPVVGLGTSIVFDMGDDAARRSEGRRVIETLVAGGGKVIDTAPAYGTAETVLGDLVAEAGVRDKLFLATKLGIKDEAASRAELEQSLQRLRTQKPDLVQLWNVRSPAQDVAILRAWKEAGHCRYIGITTYLARDYEAVAAVLKREKPDFVQVNCSILDREAEATLLPLARDVGAAVLINLPFGRGGLFRRVRDKPVPDWAAEFDASTWGQFFLKYLIGNEAVTAVIPGTEKTQHVTDNLGAARGRLPDPAMRRRMAELVESFG